MTVIRELFVLLGLKTDDKDFKKAEEALGDLLSISKKLVVGVGAVAAAATYAAHRFAGAGDAAAKTAKTLGITAEEVQELAYASERSGADFKAITTAMQKLQRSAAQGADGNKEFAETFTKLGIRVRNADGSVKTGIPLLEEFADAITKIKDPGKQAALAMKLIEEEGAARLIPFLKEGSAGIRDLRQRARDLGGVLSNEAAASAEDLTDSFTDMRLAMNAVVLRLGAAVAPHFRRAANASSAWLIQNKALVDHWIGEFAGAAGFFLQKLDQYSRLAAAVAKNSTAMKVIIGGLGLLLGLTFAAQLGAAGLALVKLARVLDITAAAGLRVTLIAAGWGLALVAVGLLLEDVITHLQGGDSLIGEMITRFGPESLTPESTWVAVLGAFIIGSIQSWGESAAAFVDIFSDHNASAVQAQQYWMHWWDDIFAYWEKQVTDIPILRELVGAARFLGGGLGDFLAQRQIEGVDRLSRDPDLRNSSVAGAINSDFAAMQRAANALVSDRARLRGLSEQAMAAIRLRNIDAGIGGLSSGQQVSLGVIAPTATVNLSVSGGDPNAVLEAARQGTEQALRESAEAARREASGG